MFIVRIDKFIKSGEIEILHELKFDDADYSEQNSDNGSWSNSNLNILNGIKATIKLLDIDPRCLIHISKLDPCGNEIRITDYGISKEDLLTLVDDFSDLTYEGRFNKKWASYRKENNLLEKIIKGLKIWKNQK